MLNFSYCDDLGHVVFSPLLGGVSASSLKPNQTERENITLWYNCSGVYRKNKTLKSTKDAIEFRVTLFRRKVLSFSTLNQITC